MSLIMEGTVPTGLEKMAAEEVQEKLEDVKTTIEQGRVFIETQVDHVDSDAALEHIRKCLALRSLDNVYCVLWQDTISLTKTSLADGEITADDALMDVAGIASKIDWHKLLSVQQLVFGEWPGGIPKSLQQMQTYLNKQETSVQKNDANDQMNSNSEPQTTTQGEDTSEDLPSFRVTCYRTGDNHPFGSPEAAATLGDHVQRQFGWRVKMKQFDLEIVLRIVDDKVAISIPMNKETLFKRNIVAFGPTTLRATIAYGLLRIAKPEPGDIILDPLCGTGAIPVEAYHEFKQTAIFGIERNEKGVSNTAENSMAAYDKQKRLSCFGRCCECIQGDSTRMPWRTGSVDCIVTDMPFGKRMGSQAGNKFLYPKLIREFARVTRPITGRAVLLTQDKKSINNVFKNNPFWKLTYTTFINVGGLAAYAYLLRRTEKLINEPDY